MKTHSTGLDVMRGIGIFFVLVLHTAFYFYHDIYDVDLDNPTPVITVIGFLLMFAGLFAMISGIVNTLQTARRLEHNTPKPYRHLMTSGVILLVIAYLYFIVTGPGIIHFDERRMDESILVALINHGSVTGVSLDRILYIDSLVMLSVNMILLGILFKVIGRRLLDVRTAPMILIGATLFMALSYVRIPLYATYIHAFDDGKMGTVLLLNVFVNKNNPVFPFFAFALFGAWIGLLLHHGKTKTLKKHGIITALAFIVIGAAGYVLAPETMLERMIDPTWYFIMVIQVGLFIALVLLALRLDRKERKKGPVVRFFSRYGVAGLTPFFLESVVSALIFLLVNLVVRFEPSIPGAILYGLVLALLWGLFLIFWEKREYRYGLEWVRASILAKTGTSSKLETLSGDRQ